MIFAIFLCGAVPSGEEVNDQSKPRPKSFQNYEIATEEFHLDILSPLLENAYLALQNGKLLESFNFLAQAIVQDPSIKEKESYQLLLAESFFRLGSQGNSDLLRESKNIFTHLFYTSSKSENSALIAFRLATIFEYNEFYPEAQAIYEYNLDSHPAKKLETKTKLGLAFSLSNTGSCTKAIPLLNEILADQSSDQNQDLFLIAGSGIGVCYWNLGNIEKSLSAFERLNLSPENLGVMDPKAVFAYGMSLLKAGDKNIGIKILTSYRKQYENETDWPSAVLALADESAAQRQYAPAVADYRLLASSYSNTYEGFSAVLRLAKLKLLVAKDPLAPDIVKDLEKLRSQFIYPDLSLDATLILAEANQKAGHSEKTLDLLDDLLRTPMKIEAAKRCAGSFSKALADVIAKHYQENNYGEIAKLMENINRHINPSWIDSAVYEKILNSLYQHLLFDRLIAFCTNSAYLNRFPEIASLYHSKALIEKGEFKPAAKIINSLRQAENESIRSQALAVSAKILQNEGRFAEALTELTSAESINPDPMEKAILAVDKFKIETLVNPAASGTSNYKKALNQISMVPLGKRNKETIADVAFGLGYELSKEGKKKEMADVFNEAASLFESDPRSAWASLQAFEASLNSPNIPNTPVKIRKQFWKSLDSRLRDHLIWMNKNKSHLDVWSK